MMDNYLLSKMCVDEWELKNVQLVYVNERLTCRKARQEISCHEHNLHGIGFHFHSPLLSL